jgi:pyruvate dehydrogenase E2 component (dihydrolipoamide acetyltransferase)
VQIDIVMPKLSDTMEQGKLLKWFKNKGDHVEKGEKIFEVETDKADMEVEAFDSGTLAEILLDEGKSAQVGTTIALITPAEQETKEAANRASQKKPETTPATAGAIKEPAQERTAASKLIDERGQAPRPTAAQKAAPEEAPPAPPGKKETKVVASPLARRIAEQLGVDLSQVKGTGPEARITKEDVESAAKTGPKEAEPSKIAKESAGGTALEELSPMRRAIAKTVVKSKTEIPHFYVTVEADVGAMVKMKESLEQSDDFSGRHLTYSHLIIKAVVQCLKKFPLFNAYFREGKIQMNRDINIGVVVAVEGGLLIPVIKNCEDLTLTQIVDRENELVQKARNGRLRAGDLTGGTFSISNAGILDVDEFSAIIYPPQSAILAVAAIKEKPKVENNRVVPAKLMKMTISVDHRMLDGILAARFLDECKFLLRNPAHLIL